MVDVQPAAPAVDSTPAPIAAPTKAVETSHVETVQSIAKSSPEVKAAPVAQPTAVTQPTQVKQPDTRQRDETGKFQPSDSRGFDLLDANEFAPDVWARIEPRLKRYHRQVKQADKNFQSLVSHNQALEKRIMEISNERELGTARQQLFHMEQQAAQAAAQGDWVTYGRLQRDITSFEAKDYTAKPIEVPQAEAFDLHETQMINQWAQTRPWAQKTHPMFKFATDVGIKLFQDPGWRQRDTEEILNEVERIMNAVMAQQPQQPQQQRPQTPQVLANNQNIRRPTSQQKSDLTGEQKFVAERMFVRTGLARNRQEAHDMYRQQLALL